MITERTVIYGGKLQSGGHFNLIAILKVVESLKINKCIVAQAFITQNMRQVLAYKNIRHNIFVVLKNHTALSYLAYA